MVWGGDRIASYKGIAPIGGIGESWEISGFEEHQTCVSGGPFDGTPINVLLETCGSEIMGERLYSRFGNRFPLLIKFIDARDDLSIQVHPDDEMARKRHNASGKTEMWYVVGASQGAHLYSGMKEEITPDDFDRLVGDNTFVDVVARHEVHPGDVFFLPAGRVHAICSGCFLAEIQQTSDCTYRIFDYGRPGLDGKPRQLHTELAREAIDYKVYPDYRTRYESVPNRETELVKCPFFTTSLLELDRRISRDISSLDSFVTVICVEGAVEVLTDEGDESLKQGETLLVCSSSSRLEFVPSCPTKLLLSYIE